MGTNAKNTLKEYNRNKASDFESKESPLRKFIDQFDVLLLDMGETFMFNVDRFGVDDGLFKTYSEFGGKHLSEEDVYQILRSVFDTLIADGRIPENYDKMPSVSSYLKRHPSAKALPLSEIDILEVVFAEHEIGHIPEKYIEILRKLSSTHRLGIISDIWSNSERFYRELIDRGVSGFFEVVIFSSDIGIIKPSPKIFSKAIEELDTDISEVVYIGDSLRRDVEGAKNFGMSAIWIKDEQKMNSNLNVQPDFIINDLQDML